MRILGIDPGTARTGWGIIEVESSKLKVLKFGCFETGSKEAQPERLQKIHSHIHALVKEFNPTSLSIEELFFNTNLKTAFAVGQARGVVLLASAELKIPSFIYTPLQVKMAVTGYGRAEKTQVGRMVKTILALKEIPKPDDTTDALAVAITHAFTAKKA